MSSRDRIVQNLEACWQSLDGLCADLGPDEWKTRSLCPDWTVHGVVSHLTAVEHGLAGWLPESADDPPPFGKVGEFMTEAEDLSGAELHDRLRAVLEVRRAELAAMGDHEFDLPSMTPVGQGTYGRFMAIREFDFWMHERDIRLPLDRPTDDGGPPAEMALDEVHGSFGYIVGKRVGMPDGSSIAVHLTGPVKRDLFAVVEGRAAVVDHLPDPDVELTTDSLTFMLLACGRIDPQKAIDDGRVTWTGDTELGDKAARNLRFTM